MANVVTANVNAGGALTYTGNGNISAWRGGFTTTFWSYNISTDTWTVKAVAPATVNTGGALAYTANGNVSALPGNAVTTFWQVQYFHEYLENESFRSCCRRDRWSAGIYQGWQCLRFCRGGNNDVLAL